MSTWKSGDPIESTAQLEVMVSEQSWQAGSMRGTDRKLCHAMTQAAKIEPWEVDVGLEAVSKLDPPAEYPVAYFLKTVRGERERASAPVNGSLAAVPKPSPSWASEETLDRAFSEPDPFDEMFGKFLPGGQK